MAGSKSPVDTPKAPPDSQHNTILLTMTKKKLVHHHPLNHLPHFPTLVFLPLPLNFLSFLSSRLFSFFIYPCLPFSSFLHFPPFAVRPLQVTECCVFFPCLVPFGLRQPHKGRSCPAFFPNFL